MGDIGAEGFVSHGFAGVVAAVATDTPVAPAGVTDGEAWKVRAVDITNFFLTKQKRWLQS